MGDQAAWIQVPDIPCLVDSSAGGVLLELDRSIVVNGSHSVGSREAVRAMFAVGRKSYHDLVTNLIGVWEALGVFPFVVLKDELLLSILNVLPVRLEGDVEHGISAKHEL